MMRGGFPAKSTRAAAMHWVLNGKSERVQVLNPPRDEVIRAKAVADQAASLLCQVKVLRTGEILYAPISQLEPAEDGPFTD
jgi:hypothetical protein